MAQVVDEPIDLALGQVLVPGENEYAVEERVGAGKSLAHVRRPRAESTKSSELVVA